MPSEENDPIAALRGALSEDDTPVPAPSRKSGISAPSAAPPPLPKAKSGVILPGGAPIPPFQVGNLPPALQRPPPGDPFQEPPEPRIPVGVDAEEKLKVFRGIIRGKDEALGRGRALYQAVDFEAQQLRALAVQMKAQLELALVEVQRAADYPQQVQILKDMLEKDTIRADEAEKKMENLVVRFAEADNERRDLTNALAEVEHQYREASSRLDGERKTRKELAEELINVKDALSLAQNRVTALADRLTQAKVLFDSMQAQVAEAVQLKAEQAEEIHRLRAELEQASKDGKTLTHRMETAARKLQAAEEEKAQAAARILVLEREIEDVLSARDALSAELGHRQAAMEEQRTKLESLEAELERNRQEHPARIAALESQLQDATQQMQVDFAHLKNQLGSAHASDATAQAEIAQLRNQIIALSDKNAAAVQEAGQLRGALQAVQAAVEHDSGAAASQLSAMQVKLAQANQRSAVLEGKLKELFERTKAAELRASEHEARAAKAEGHARAGPTAKLESLGELEKLKSENANLKKKLMSAETAMEAAALLRAKVAKLEAQLKGTPKS